MLTHKRIFQTTEPYADVMSHAVHGVVIRPAKNGAPGEYVVEGPSHEKRLVDKIVELFDGK